MMGMSPEGLNCVVFDADALFDLKVGAALVLKNMFSNSKNMVDTKFLHMNNQKSLMQYHIAEGDPFLRALADEIKPHADSLLEDMKMNPLYNKSLFESSPKTSAHRLLMQYTNVDYIKCTIIHIQKDNDMVDNQIYNYCSDLRRDVPESIRVEVYPTREDAIKNLMFYSRIITDSTKHALEFIGLENKSLVVLDYKDNFKVIDGKQTLDPELIYMFGDVNNLEYCNAYTDLELPEG